MAIQGQGLVDEADNGSAKPEEKVTYVLHPNCAVEEAEVTYAQARK